jgi:hypothetical protein
MLICVVVFNIVIQTNDKLSDSLSSFYLILRHAFIGWNVQNNQRIFIDKN